MPIKIVTDSTCDLPSDVIAAYNIAIVPLYINVDGKSYLDGVELSREEFYARLPQYKTPPTTSAPGPGMFSRVYEQLAASGATEILSIHISSALSNVANVAQLAAQATESIAVQVWDAGQITLGTGLQVLAAAKAIAQGNRMSEIVSMLQDMGRRTHSFAALDTLEFLRRSGRLTRLQASLGSVLQIKPLLKMYDGNVSMERVRTSRRAVERLIELASELAPLESIALVHTHAIERSNALSQRIKQAFPIETLPFSEEVTPVIGTHVGPGGVGLVCVKAQ